MKVPTKTNSANYFKEYFLAVDPGSAGTGIAAFIENNFKEPLFTKILEHPKGTWEEKCNYICMQFRYIIKGNLWIRSVYCEQPQYMSTYKGQTSADSGSLFKLCALYGRLWEITESLGKKFFPVEIPKWKGQLDKEKVKYRVDRILPNNDYRSHAIDAVGIGLFVKGIF